jgi:hypothetical protein
LCFRNEQVRMLSTSGHDKANSSILAEATQTLNTVSFPGTYENISGWVENLVSYLNLRMPSIGHLNVIDYEIERQGTLCEAFEHSNELDAELHGHLATHISSK